ncbi:MAG TPA: hypothetical protein VMF66_05680 [Candidatus Acidoferrum sp.]|nr:hypothetical protein [Candidatus Acidoferrum sp.]
MTRRLVALCAVLVFAAPCFARKDNQFQALVKAIESEYGVHHTRIPFLGLATFCMRVGKVPGATGLKVAVFENLPNSDVAANGAFQESVEKIMGSAWHPMVKARSRDDSSLTMIYTNPNPGELRLLIVSIDGSEATVVRTNLQKAQIYRWVSHPEDAVERNGDSSADAELAAAGD